MNEKTNAITAKQKQDNYREQFIRLKKALNSEFYLEAIFIEYAIIEDRTRAILVHAGKYEAYLKKRGRYQENLNSKIKYIQAFAAEKETLLNKFFGDELLTDILDWKEKRNQLIHALLNHTLTTEELAKMAEKGDVYCRTLRDKVTNYKKAKNKNK